MFSTNAVNGLAIEQLLYKRSLYVGNHVACNLPILVSASPLNMTCRHCHVYLTNTIALQFVTWTCVYKYKINGFMLCTCCTFICFVTHQGMYSLHAFDWMLKTDWYQMTFFGDCFLCYAERILDQGIETCLICFICWLMYKFVLCRWVRTSIWNVGYRFFILILLLITSCF